MEVKRGLYIVTLNNLEPIHVNAQDPRDQGRSITVNKDNCKFGKAKDFEKRKKNYNKTFGEENVNFEPLVALEEIDEVEKLVLDSLDEYRIRGRTGRKNEWLENIEIEDLISIIFEVLDSKKIRYKKLKTLNSLYNNKNYDKNL